MNPIRSVRTTASRGRAALLAGAAAPARAQAQAAPSAPHTPDQAAAYAVVVQLFDGMRTRDTVAMRAAFEANATLHQITPEGVRAEPIENWFRSVAGAPAGLVLDERLANAVVHVDGDLASVWVDYWFFAGERFSHCGVDAILLARRGGVWRIFSVADTRRREGCAPAPPR